MIDTAAEHYRERINDLCNVIDGARAHRELAMHRAHQAGVTPEQIAR